MGAILSRGRWVNSRRLTSENAFEMLVATGTLEQTLSNFPVIIIHEDDPARCGARAFIDTVMSKFKHAYEL